MPCFYLQFLSPSNHKLEELAYKIVKWYMKFENLRGKLSGDLVHLGNRMNGYGIKFQESNHFKFLGKDRTSCLAVNRTFARETLCSLDIVRFVPGWQKISTVFYSGLRNLKYKKAAYELEYL